MTSLHMELDPSKPVFKTSDIAYIMGVSTEYVRRQVRDGKLHASTRRLSYHRTVLRFSFNDVNAYDSDAALRLQQRYLASVPRSTTPTQQR